jgi:MtN3 and saliva related transmembrane protein
VKGPTTELIGWLSSASLLVTIVRQVFSQWKSGAIAGVSKWLFIGQITASSGYVVYSFLLHNWVFPASNLSLLITAIVGELIYLLNRRRKTAAAAAATA